MTEKKVTYALNKIKSCKEKGFMMEALLRTYHLNVELIKYILSACSDDYLVKDKKVKAVFHKFMEEVSVNPKLKAVLNKRNVKVMKPWLEKMDLFFKVLKMKQPLHVKILQSEAEKIMAILNISAAKLFVQAKT
jgi:hypothetical protein